MNSSQDRTLKLQAIMSRGSTKAKLNRMAILVYRFMRWNSNSASSYTWVNNAQKCPRTVIIGVDSLPVQVSINCLLDHLTTSFASWDRALQHE